MSTPLMAIEHRAVRELIPYTRNARTHSKKQIRQIADSIQCFGFTNPVLIGDDDGIIAGHGRIAAAKLFGMQTVPTVRLSHLSEADRRAYVLADSGRCAHLIFYDPLYCDTIIRRWQKLTGKTATIVLKSTRRA